MNPACFPLRRLLRSASAALTAVMVLAMPARATDLSDLWWNPNESGWGVNVAQQAEVLYLTFYVYDPARAPTWFVAILYYKSTTPAGALVFDGRLYRTAGPWFGGAFNAQSVATTDSGSATLTVTGISNATLDYTVNGVAVSKQITRQTWRDNPSVVGNFFGALVGEVSGCGGAGGAFAADGTMNVTRSGANATFEFQFSSGVCTFAGPYTQSGRMGSLAGTATCSGNVRGAVTLVEVEANSSGLTLRYSGDYGNGCRESGRFGGVRQ